MNGIDMEFIFKKREISPETGRLRTERNRILQPQRTRKAGKGKDNERVQEYRPNQQGRNQVERLNIEINNQFFLYCELIVTTPLQVFLQNNNESWMSTNSVRENQTSHVKQDRCPTTVLRKFRRHEITNLTRLKQTAKLHTKADDEKTAESIETTEKDFAMDLPLLVEEIAGDAKILNPITGVENGRIDDIFYPYRPHRDHFTTRFGLLF